MKLAFIFMLVLNVGFFGWQFTQSDSPAPIKKVDKKNKNGRLQTITLLHEVNESSFTKRKITPVRKVVKTSVVKNTAIENTRQTSFATGSTSISERLAEAKAEKEAQAKDEIVSCYRLGPYSVKLNATQSMAKSKSYGAIVKMHTKEKRERFRYWVLTPTRNKKAALKKIKKFKEKGVSDVYLIREGKKKDDISLGIFRARTTAQKRILALKKLGFNPIVEKHYKIKTEFWLGIEETLRHPITNAAWKDIIGGFDDIEKTEESC